MVAFDVATQLQDGYRFWQLSPYSWWVAPLILRWTCPDTPVPNRWLAWPLFILVWADWRLHGLLFKSIDPWYLLNPDAIFDVPELVLRGAVVGLIAAVAFARPLACLCDAVSTRAAVVVGLTVAFARCYESLLNADLWIHEPFSNLGRILNVGVVVLLLVIATDRQRRFLELREIGITANATGSVTSERRAKTLPESAGFGGVFPVATIAIAVAWCAWELIENPSIAGVVVAMAWALPTILVTQSVVNAWRQPAGVNGTAKLFGKARTIFRRADMLIGVGLLWICTIWIVAPMTGSTLLGLMRGLTGQLWSIHADSDRRTLVIEGEFRHGLADALRSSLRDQPGIMYVELTSGGGSANEGWRIAETIQERGLTTIVREYCSSACVTALAAGRSRWLVDGARVGLHAPSQFGLPMDLESSAKGEDLRLLGVAEDLVLQGSAVPHRDAWYPTERELLESGLITRILIEEDMVKETLRAGL